MHLDLPIEECVDIVKRGIEKKYKTAKPKKVVIVGAGLAGLAAGYELLQAGHEVLILAAGSIPCGSRSRRDCTARRARCAFPARTS
ncbi:MAG TPA: FAD-dependent oxidoreductase [Anaerolineales bacterium]|nr:FAD-dependent oxidoreductase [Anaerolineales bacterium]